MKYYLLLLFFLLATESFSQKKKLPLDLDSEKIIFFQYEEIPIPSGLPKYASARYKSINTVIKRSNPKLVSEAKKYPFEYTISKRGIYDQLEGYKYILNSKYAEDLNNGTFFPNNPKKRYYFDVYIENIETKEKYPLFEINDGDLFDHKEVMTKLARLVKKEYNLK